MLALVEISEFEVPKVRPQDVDAAMEEAVQKLICTRADVHSEPRPGPARGTLRKNHMDALRSFAEKPFIGLEERRVGLEEIHPELLSRLIRDLQEMGFLGELESYGLGKAKPKKTAFVTEKGAEVLHMPYKHCVPAGKGGVQHRFLQDLLRRHFGTAVKEWMSGDVVRYHKDGSTTVYEIELDDASNEHFLRNIETDGSLFDRIVVIARSQDLRAFKRKAKERISADLLKRVTFKRIAEVLKQDDV
jgi:hypothetical protein